MRILGVDPGLTRCGVGIIDIAAGRRASLVDVRVIQTSKDLETPERLLILQRELESLVERYQPDRIAVERVFAQHNLRTVMGTAQASAVVFLEAATRDVPLTLHTPSEVKAAVTGNGRANKAQVATMVKQILGVKDVAWLPDASDALALAICHAWRGSAAVSETTALTPAQQRWRQAESLSKRKGSSN